MGKYNLSFDTVEPSRLGSLADFMSQNVGGYDLEEHRRWLESVCLPGLEEGSRLGLAWWRGGQVIGDGIIVPRDFGVELKHFRVDPDELWLRGRGLGDFMMRQILAEASEHVQASEQVVRLHTILGSPVVSFFERHGFVQVGIEPTPTHTNVVMEFSIAA
jgi:ribosomal protein S18 acetylase RimI-like enzyme